MKMNQWKKRMAKVSGSFFILKFNDIFTSKKMRQTAQKRMARRQMDIQKIHNLELPVPMTMKVQMMLLRWKAMRLKMAAI